jgi:SAM-dependent methyltransferase
VLDGAERYNDWIYARVGGAVGRRVLEIGCGTGTITQYIADRELVVGVDVVDDYVASTRQRFRGQTNVEIRLQDITQSITGLAAYRFDSALSVNVFEHIEDDVFAMKVVHSLLVPGGAFTLLVPCHPLLMSPFDRAIGHYRRYTRRSLRKKLEAAEFRVERLRRSNPVGALGWLLFNTLLRSTALRGVGFYDRLVPLLARLDRVVEFPVGLSLVAVGRKP